MSSPSSSSGWLQETLPVGRGVEHNLRLSRLFRTWSVRLSELTQCFIPQYSTDPAAVLGNPTEFSLWLESGEGLPLRQNVLAPIFSRMQELLSFRKKLCSSEYR